MHQPYEERLGRSHDFTVAYRFYTPEEGGRWNPVYQGYRSDFDYDQEIPENKGIYMIWPEFEDEDGFVITESETPVLAKGTARMWIISAHTKPLHQKYVKVGTKGYFMEGNKRVAECKIIKIGSLFSNK
ncbi:hypothetical protein [Salmonirosea aquatica]|uniref:Uncharacterized protein n=1 Tax=Salmonirosea aquatica TaxID=2654236 RepID=A0A7C9BGE6_9BACT|nr:hypothetical protein [Cytophagaceae bacterium SJW1-29]